MTPPYNYARFDEHIEQGGDDEFAAFADHLHVGQRAPSFRVIPLDGGDGFDIEDLWRRRDVVMEFGSFT